MDTGLKIYMTENQLTDREMAEKIGISIAMVNMIKNGERNPSSNLAARIEQLTGIDARILLGIPKPENGNGDQAA